MARNFNKLGQTFPEWAGMLQQILDALHDAIQAQDLAGRRTAFDDLNDFIDESPNSVASSLDDLARKTIDTTFDADWAAALQSIASRTADLTVLVKQVRSATAAANDAAASIRLENIRTAVDSLTAAVKAVTDVRADIKGNATADKLGDDIDKVVASIQKIRAQLETFRPA
jgi:hypothetical protein